MNDDGVFMVAMLNIRFDDAGMVMKKTMVIRVGDLMMAMMMMTVFVFVD